MQSGFENDPQEERGLIYKNVELRLTNYPCEVFDKTAHPYWMTQMEIAFLIDGVRFVWVVFDKMLDPYGVTQIAILIVGSKSVGVACACSCSDYNNASLDFEICPLAMLNNDIQEMPSLALHFPKTSNIVILAKKGSGINPQPTLPRVGSEGVLPTCVMYCNAGISKGQQVIDASKSKVISSISNKFRMEYRIKEKEIELKNAVADFRFPTTNQSRHCFTRYIEFHSVLNSPAPKNQVVDSFFMSRNFTASVWQHRETNLVNVGNLSNTIGPFVVVNG
ncbi:hypothetical protein RHSIM_Rhsim09G0075200 [Rhododendron simsii]|uniref:Uncharacterized protein n=1 Tax=Rhododendron simsii TaxID=118357 RepID=A0A834GHK9_RHOSS|nr:hypothetical protein RHSIM_Rhsim09G0075200 [Rhododendron simsii]